MTDAMKLIVRTSVSESQVALLRGDSLCEFYRDELSAESLVGSVMLGRVERVLPDVHAAFIKIGLSQNGFLPLRESESYHRKQGNAPLMSGQDVLVQVKKDPKGGKGAFLTRDITLAGQYTLIMPNNLFFGTSKRITDEKERKRAKRLGEELSKGRFGVIVRHAALFATREDVFAEAEALFEEWKQLESKAVYQKSPAMLRKEPGMLEVLLRDYAARHELEVFSTDDRPQDAPTEVVWQKQSATELDALWRAKRVEAQLQSALGRRVELAGGGSLVIDEREALQTVDVNSGSAVMTEGDTALALESNLSAVDEIARQIRLRNLSGIILIDFIDMRTDAERERVQAAVEEAVSDDRVKTVVHGFTSLGLLELTRKRTRDSLRDALTTPCKACHETGRVPIAP